MNYISSLFKRTVGNLLALRTVHSKNKTGIIRLRGYIRLLILLLIVSQAPSLYGQGDPAKFSKAGTIADGEWAIYDTDNSSLELIDTAALADEQGRWVALGEGTDGPVHAIVVDMEGNIYAGGNFTRAGGATVNNIAKWDGTNWSALGTGIIGGSPQTTNVNALALDQDGNLYAGGNFLTAGGVDARDIARWDGSRWSAVGDISPSGWGEVHALAFDSEGTLYMAGDIDFQYGEVPRIGAFGIVQWDGSTWRGVGPIWETGPITRRHQGVNGCCRTLVIDEADNVYVGGIVSAAGGEPTSKGIVMWDGESWNALENGVDGPGIINSLVVEGSNLYAGGQFTVAGNVIADNVAVWNGSEWNAVGGGIPTSSLVERVMVLSTDAAGRLYAGGTFTESGGAPSSYLTTWNGTNWGPLEEGIDGYIFALNIDELNNLYVGGISFYQPASFNNIAKLETTVGTSSEREPTNSGIPDRAVLHQNYPNPFNPSTTFVFELPEAAMVRLEVYDVLGRTVATVVSEQLAAGRYEHSWDAGHLPSGVYLYRLEVGEHREMRRMVLVK